MDTTYNTAGNTSTPNTCPQVLRAIVELINGELRIYAVGSSDEECAEIIGRLLLGEQGRK